MQPREAPLFDRLLEIHRRPEPFAESTARELWTDFHTSERMLAFHLDDTVDAATVSVPASSSRRYCLPSLT